MLELRQASVGVPPPVPRIYPEAGMSRKHIQTWGGNGYPPQDTGPITPEEQVRMARRRELEPEDAGRRPRPAKRDTESRKCTGMEGTAWE
jgi:hypothetical protein